jgi:hypothetical protein
MALPLTGQLKFSDVNVELERSPTASISLDQVESIGFNRCSTYTPNGVRPATAGEWRGYNHTAIPFLFLTNTQGGVESSEDACILTGTTQRSIYTSSFFNGSSVVDRYYEDAGCSPVLRDGFHRNSTATTWYEFLGGFLQNSGACPTTTTTTSTSTSATCVCNLKTLKCSSGCTNTANFDCGEDRDCS